MKSLVLLLVVALALIPSSHSDDSCPSGWIRWQNNCYKYHSEKLNFQDAEARCNEFVPYKETCSCQTAHLASIESADENTFLWKKWRKVRGPIEDARFHRVHIGYTDESKEDSWQWVDGSSSDYTNWDSESNEPNNRLSEETEEKENCAVMWNKHNDKGNWNDEFCSKENPFFCKFRLV